MPCMPRRARLASVGAAPCSAAAAGARAGRRARPPRTARLRGRARRGAAPGRPAAARPRSAPRGPPAGRSRPGARQRPGSRPGCRPAATGPTPAAGAGSACSTCGTPAGGPGTRARARTCARGAPGGRRLGVRGGCRKADHMSRDYDSCAPRRRAGSAAPGRAAAAGRPAAPPRCALPDAASRVRGKGERSTRAPRLYSSVMSRPASRSPPAPSGGLSRNCTATGLARASRRGGCAVPARAAAPQHGRAPERRLGQRTLQKLGRGGGATLQRASAGPAGVRPLATWHAAAPALTAPRRQSWRVAARTTATHRQRRLPARAL